MLSLLSNMSSEDRKFMTRKMKELLLSIHNKPLEVQNTLLKKHHLEWKGDSEQTDDILVIGIKV